MRSRGSGPARRSRGSERSAAERPGSASAGPGRRRSSLGSGPVGEVRLLGAADVRALAVRFDVAPTKKLGQNFVHDANTVRRIVRLPDGAAGETVLEIGPGLGSLTLGLLEAGAAVVAVELDRRLAAALPGTAAERAGDI